MSIKTEIAIGISVVVIAFAAGRYTAPTPASHTVETVKQDEKKATDTEEKKTTVITKKPDGEEVTTITDDTSTVTKEKDVTDTKIDETVAPKSLVNISGILGVDMVRDFAPVYGVSIQKSFLGPVTGGVFGLTNGTIGVSIGLNF